MYEWSELLTALRQWEPAYMATIWSREHQVACSRCPHSPWRAKTFSPMSYRSISRQKHTAAAQASPPPAATLVQVDFDENLFLITWGQLVNWRFCLEYSAITCFDSSTQCATLSAASYCNGGTLGGVAINTICRKLCGTCPSNFDLLKFIYKRIIMSIRLNCFEQHEICYKWLKFRV